MCIEDKFTKKYSACLTDFKTLSFDSKNKKSLCQNTTHKYFNFDEIVKKRNCKPTPASPDALIFKDNKIYCVEFKNSFNDNVKASVIKKKLENGHKVLSEIFTELSLQLKNYQLIFCVVHKGFNETEVEKKNRKWEKLRYRIKERHIIQFDLAQFKGKYFDEIITKDVNFFRDQFIEKIDSDLPC